MYQTFGLEDSIFLTHLEFKYSPSQQEIEIQLNPNQNSTHTHTHTKTQILAFEHALTRVFRGSSIFLGKG